MKKFSLLFSACMLTLFMFGSSQEAEATNVCNPGYVYAVLHSSAPIDITDSTPVNLYALGAGNCDDLSYTLYFPSTGHTKSGSTPFMSFIPNQALVVGSNTVEFTYYKNGLLWSGVTFTLTGI